MSPNPIRIYLALCIIIALVVVVSEYYNQKRKSEKHIKEMEVLNKLEMEVLNKLLSGEIKMQYGDVQANKNCNCSKSKNSKSKSKKQKTTQEA